MPIYRGTIIFSGPNHGWTESYSRNDPSENYVDIMNHLIELAGRRWPLLGAQCSITALRVSRVDRKNDGFTQNFERPGTSQCDSDEPDACLVVQCHDANFGRRKTIFLRGIPDEIDVRFGQFVSAPCNFELLFNNFVTQLRLVPGAWGWIGRPLSGPRRANMVGYATLAGQVGLITFDFPIFNGEPVGAKVLVTFGGVNTPAKSTLVGQQVCIVDSNTTCHLAIPLAAFPYSNGGHGLFIPSEHIAIRGVTISRIGTRRVGAPLLASRGRQRARGRG